jgi:hypothetical protein
LPQLVCKINIGRILFSYNKSQIACRSILCLDLSLPNPNSDLGHNSTYITQLGDMPLQKGKKKVKQSCNLANKTPEHEYGQTLHQHLNCLDGRLRETRMKADPHSE